MDPENKIQNKSIETYAEDMAKVIESEKESGLIKKIIHEQEQYDIERKNISPQSKKNKIFIVSSVVLFFLAFIVLISLGVFKKKSEVVNMTPRYTPPIFIDQNYFQDINNLNKEQIAQSILNEVNNTKVKMGGIEGIYLTENKKVIGFSRFMILEKANTPLGFSNFINDTMLIGVFNSGVPKVAPQIVLPVDIKPKVDMSVPIIVVEGTPVTLNSSAFFKTGTADFVDVDAKDKAKQAIIDFLDGIDFATSKIQVIGTYSIERPSPRNDQIAETRKKLGVDILNEVLNEKYNVDDIAKITIESSAKGMSINDTYTKEEIEAMTEDETKNAIDMTQGIQYIALAKTKSKTILAPVPEVVPPIITEVKKNPTTPAASTATDLFLLLKVTSRDDVFPVLRNWESKMFSDLHGFFGIELSADKNYLLTKNFEDGFIVNKNARILKDKEGNIVLMYIFANENSIIVTNSREATSEVILRLAGSQIKK